MKLASQLFAFDGKAKQRKLQFNIVNEQKQCDISSIHRDEQKS
jgi:hypothetical protein